jgi:hypothetical protein
MATRRWAARKSDETTLSFRYVGKALRTGTKAPPRFRYEASYGVGRATRRVCSRHKRAQ